MGDCHNKNRIIIGITGAEWYNKGSEAMLRSAINEFNELGDFGFVIFVTEKKLLNTNPFKEVRNIDVVLYNTAKAHFFSELFWTFLFSYLKNPRLINKTDNLINLNRCDALIGLYGYALHNRSGFAVHSLYLGKLLIAKFLGKKYVVFPQDVEYLDSKISRFLFRYIFARADLIAVRGEGSFVNVKKMCNVDQKNIVVVPDIAFCLPKKPLPDETFSSWLEERKSGNKVVVVSVNKKVKRSGTDLSYIDMLTLVIESLVRKNKLVVLMPHDVRGAQDTHDLRVCHKIFSQLSEDAQRDVYVVDNLYFEPGMYKEIVSHCDMALTSRFHMTVATLSQNVPTVTLGYSFKYMQLLSWFGLEKRALDGERVTPEQVVTALELLESDASKIRPCMRDTNHEISKQVKQFFIKVTALLNN